MLSTDDRLTILLAQLDAAWEMLDARLSERHPFSGETGSMPSTLTDDEYFREPVPNCWSLRRRDERPEITGIGKGEWVLEGQRPEPQPPPVTTIAWRVCHLAWGTRIRYDYTFGTHSLTHDDVVWPASAADGVAFLHEQHRKWRDSVAGLPTEALDQIGRSQSPYGLDRQVRFIDLLSWTNLEFAHHAAEIACLRDLYRAENRNP